MITMGPSIALPSVKAGKLNMLGFGGEKRVAQFLTCRPSPKQCQATRRPCRSACSPEGHAAEILVKINADVQQIINDPEFHKRSSSRWWCSRSPDRMEAFAEYLRKDSVKWAKVISAANLKID